MASLSQIARCILDGGRLALPGREQLPEGELGTAYLDLMQRCWAQNPQDRPTFSQIAAELK